jgi:hypothetical protein
MASNTRIRLCGAAIIIFLLAALGPAVDGQWLESVVEARARVFPTVGPGVTAIKRDSAGHYYVVAKPATSVSIFGSDGNLLLQIPNANSGGAVIRYAVDIDLSSDGLLYVVDRGGNAVEVFHTDGSLVSRIPVASHTSVVALPAGQFAVTSLTSNRLVQIFYENGKARSFGDPADIQQDADKKILNDWGKIVGSSAGDIYFAFSSLPDPLLRKYDRYGYVGYETSVPKDLFEAGKSAAADRVEVRLNLTHVSLSDQTTGWLSVGSSGAVKFGGGMGTGLSRLIGPGGGFGRAGMHPGMGPSGFGSTSGGPGVGTLGGTFSGEITDQGPQFQFGAGKISSLGGGRGRRGAGMSGNDDIDQQAQQGTMLQFLGSGTDGTDPYATATQTLAFTEGDSGAAGAFTGEASGGNDNNQNLGSSAAVFYGTMFNSVGFQPLDISESTPGALPGGGMRFDHPSFGRDRANGPNAEGYVGSPRFGDAHFGPHGRFGPGEEGFTITLRVNLGSLASKTSIEKPVIATTGVDPSTHELWVAMDNALIRFNQGGKAVEVYYLNLKGGVPLKPSAVLVEPDRFLVAADPWGIFEFARTK